jgi:hypothetical protein
MFWVIRFGYCTQIIIKECILYFFINLIQKVLIYIFQIYFYIIYHILQNYEDKIISIGKLIKN